MPTTTPKQAARRVAEPLGDAAFEDIQHELYVQYELYVAQQIERGLRTDATPDVYERLGDNCGD